MENRFNDGGWEFVGYLQQRDDYAITIPRPCHLLELGWLSVALDGEGRK
jgi:hypothetical protein